MLLGVAYVSAQSEPLIADVDGMELQAFFGKFPKINGTVYLEGGICEICGCITTFCRSDGNSSYVTSLQLGRRDSPGNGTGLGDGGCRGYMDCPKDSFNVTLEESDWPEFQYLTEFRITNGLGTGTELLRGPLPTQLPLVSPYLSYIQVYGSGLQGAVPSTWFASRVWPLGTLQLFDNPNLRGQLPNIADDALPHLAELTIKDSPLMGGTVPSVGKLGLPDPRRPDQATASVLLVNLGLTGTLPADFASGGAVSSLDLTNNSVTGTLPASWGEAGHFGFIRQMILANNSLQGTVPKSWSQILKTTGTNGALTLHLAGNKLEGSIPASFGASNRYFANNVFVRPGNSFCGRAPNNTLLLIAQGNSLYNDEVNATLPAC
ncbi:hypothetical protein WJX73_005955 [Symbiochloris irregularis]|uniref:Uncharacterized protein n=1 Tax=Symbiochloris irregularis TaxID=706552 RepID=A0AAW1PEA9_9CHLO